MKVLIDFRLLLIILIFIIARLINIGGLEPFTDEAGNILTSIDYQTNQNIDPVALGRPLLSYIFKLSAISTQNALEIARASTSVISLFGCLVLYFIVSLISGRNAALVTCLVWALSTYHIAHERLALQDPFTTFLLLLCCITLMKTAYQMQAVPIIRSRLFLYILLAGIFFGLTLLNKVSSISGILWILAINYLYAKKIELKISLSDLIYFCGIFLLGNILTLVSTGRVFEIGSKLQGQQFIPTISYLFNTPEQFLTIYLKNIGNISNFYFQWLIGYGGIFAILLLLYVFCLGIIWGSLVQRVLVVISISYLFLNAAMYSDFMYARYIHHESILSCFLVGICFSSLNNDLCKVRVQGILKLIFVTLFFLSLTENLISNYSVIKDANLTWIRERSLDYRQYSDQFWSGYKLDVLDQEIQKVILDNPDAYFLTSTEFDSVAYGLKLKYHGSLMANRLLPLQIYSTTTAPGLSYYQQTYPKADFYLILSLHNAAKFIEQQGMHILAIWLKASLQVINTISRATDSGNQFVIMRIGKSNYQQADSKPLKINGFPYFGGSSVLITSELLKVCEFQDISIRSIVGEQNVKTRGATSKSLIINSSLVKLQDLDLSEQDLPISIDSSKWQLNFIKGGYGAQEIRSIEFQCSSN